MEWNYVLTLYFAYARVVVVVTMLLFTFLSIVCMKTAVWFYVKRWMFGYAGWRLRSSRCTPRDQRASCNVHTAHTLSLFILTLALCCSLSIYLFICIYHLSSFLHRSCLKITTTIYDHIVNIEWAHKIASCVHVCVCVLPMPQWMNCGSDYTMNWAFALFHPANVARKSWPDRSIQPHMALHPHIFNWR